MNQPVDRLRVEAIFLEAIEVPTSERRELLRARCGDDPALLAEVDSLLASHDAEGGIPELVEEQPFGGRYPDRIGSYRIVRPLGEGGMGVVLLAIREGAGFEQTVALKLLRGGTADPALVRRMEEERRILAQLEHPGIARLVDGGMTDEGQPYYAMEYVRGDDILSWCDERRLSLESRLELFMEVCDAIQYAHQQLIVHRDLKPSNIIVTPEGHPKLLDFGIAKNLQSPGASEPTAPWGTKAYASPEQVAQGRVSTLSDVYALGVLLCELLAGRRPGVSATPSELVAGANDRDTGGAEPGRRPEEVALSRGTTVARLGRRLRGDLDAIVRTAMAHDPADRYGSAAALREDVRRFLDDRPVSARPGSIPYLVGKFVRRRRGAVVAGTLLTLSLGSGIGGVLWQARRAAAQRDVAEIEAARARQVTALMTDIFRLGDPTNTLGDTIGVRQVLGEGVRRVEETLDADPVLQATLLMELARVHRNLGLLVEADRLAGQALALREQNEPRSLAHAEALGFRGLVLRDASRTEEAIDHLERGIALREMILPAPDTVLATLAVALGWEVRSRGDHERAGDLFSRAMAIQRAELGPAHPAVATSMLGLASAFHDLGRFDESEQLFRDALSGGTTQASPVAATALVSLGLIRRLREEYRDAEPLLRAGLAMRETLYDRAHPDVIEAREQLGLVLSSLGSFAEAETLIDENLRIAIEVLGEEHERTRGSREAMATLDHTLGRFALAAARLDSVIAAKRRALGGDHAGVVYTLLALGDVLLEAGRASSADARYREALAMGERLGGTEGVYGALARDGLARSALAGGDVARSDSLSGEAMALALATLRPDHRYVLAMRRTQARIALARNEGAAAEEILREVLGAEQSARPHPHPRIGETLALIGDSRAIAGDVSGAAAARREAQAELVRLPPEHPLRRKLSVSLGTGTQ